VRAVVVTASALVVLLAAGVSGLGAAPRAGAAACDAARVSYAPYPGHDPRLASLPWVRGEPEQLGLVGLLWYWPDTWMQRRARTARIFTGGVTPAGHSTKILWAFLGPSAKGRGGSRLLVDGRRLDGPGRFTQEFAAISYQGQRGAPSYASIVEVPGPGCWRLRLSTGSLRASVVFRATRAG